MDAGDAAQTVIYVVVGAGALYAHRRGIISDRKVSDVQQESNRDTRFIALIEKAQSSTDSALGTYERQLTAALKRIERLEERIERQDEEIEALKALRDA